MSRNLEKITHLLEKLTQTANKAFVFTAGLFLVLMMLLTVLNIVGRFFGLPIKGAVELTGFFGAVTATFALAYTQLKLDHISVTVLRDCFPKPVKKTAGVLNDLLCMAFSLIAAVKIFSIANSLMLSGEVTETLRICFYPFVYAASAGFFMLVLIFLTELLRTATNNLTNPPEPFAREFEQEPQ